MSDERLSFNFPYTSTTTIAMFPPEILTTIFCFVGPSSLRHPYPYLPLRLACRRWRDIIISDSRFWTVLYLDRNVRVAEPRPFDLNKEVIHRSSSRGLDVFTYAQQEYSFAGPDSQLAPFLHKFVCSDSLRPRIRTLLLSKLWEYLSYLIRRLSNISFPQLERLTGTLTSTGTNDQLLVTLIATSRLRYAELPWTTMSHLYNQNLLHHLSHIEWLKLGRSRVNCFSENLISHVHDILENMPNLQILILAWKGSRLNRLDDFDDHVINKTSGPVITLPRLRILSLEVDHRHGDFWTFHAPNLDYVSVLDFDTRHYLDREFQNWALLDRLDFSKINSILIKIHERPAEDDYYGYPGIQHIACISCSEHIDCSAYENFHHEGLNSCAAIDDYLDLPPKNRFHIPISWTSDFHRFEHILKLATHLFELTLNYGAVKNGPHFHLFLTRILSRAGTRLTQLNVIQGRSFVEACTLFKDGATAPCLERFVYHNASKVKGTAFIPGRVKVLQNARLEAGSPPLKILELRNFANIPPARVQEIEDLGIQLIQTNNNNDSR